MTGYDLAVKRVTENPELYPYQDIILYDWPDKFHYYWVAVAPVKEIVKWAIEVDFKEDENG